MHTAKQRRQTHRQAQTHTPQDIHTDRQSWLRSTSPVFTELWLACHREYGAESITVSAT